MNWKEITVCAALLTVGCGARVPPSGCAKTISDCLESCDAGNAVKDDYSTTPSSQRDTRTPCEQVCYRSCGSASSQSRATTTGTTSTAATPTGAASEPMMTPEPPPIKENPAPTATP